MRPYYRYYFCCFLVLLLARCGGETPVKDICPLDVANFSISGTTFSPGTNLTADLTFLSPTGIDSSIILTMTEFYLSTDPFFSADDLFLVAFPNQQIDIMNQQISIRYDIIEIPFINVSSGEQYLLAYIPEQPCKDGLSLPETTEAIFVVIN